MGIDCWGYMYFVWILGLIGVFCFFFVFFGSMSMEEGK